VCKERKKITSVQSVAGSHMRLIRWNCGYTRIAQCTAFASYFGMDRNGIARFDMRGDTLHGGTRYEVTPGSAVTFPFRVSAQIDQRGLGPGISHRPRLFKSSAA
jgi:hypothetical protein